MFIALVALAIGTANSPTAMQHQVRVDHASGAVDTRYSADVRIEHRQVGSVGTGGRPATLRCMWRAGLMVDRHARHASGSTMARSFAHDNALEGSRPGWCSTQRTQIAREVAGRSDELRAHFVRLAQDDHSVLHGEIDRLHGTTRAG